jgi:ABC-type antimicrobial peptide transport system permease subunit
MAEWKEEIRKCLAHLKLAPMREAEIVEELAQHLEDRYQELRISGAADEAAARAALAELSEGQWLAHELRRIERPVNDEPEALGARRASMIGDVWYDLRYGLRMLGKNPGFTVIAVLTLALGIGANTAVFSLIDAFLLRLLPVKDPQQLVFIQAALLNGETNCCFPASTFEQFRDRSRSFSGLFAVRGTGNTKVLPVSVTVNGEPEIVAGDFVSGSYFEVLGVPAVLGRTFTIADDKAGKEPVAVISYTYWERRFGRDPAAVGKTIYAGKIPFAVIGVTPPSFFGRSVAGRSADVILPLFMHAQLRLRGEGHSTYEIVARLKPNINLEQARTDLELIYQQILRQEVASTSAQVDQANAAQRIELLPALRGQQNWLNDFATQLPILLAVVGLVLLIACVNVANLLLVRAAARQKEIAVRLSLGASRGRLVRQLLTESTLLAVLGGVLGLVLALWAEDFLLALISSGQTAIPADLRLNVKMLAFTGVISLLTGLLFGLAPALAATRINLTRMLKEGDAGAESRPRRLTKLLVVAQVALSLILLAGAGLLIGSLRQLYAVDTGFERNQVLTMRVLPALINFDQARERRLYQELLTKLNAIPGVQSASLARFVAGRGGPVAPRYFETMGIGLVQGREFFITDTADSSKVAVISESVARKYFPGANPLGQLLPNELAKGFGGASIEIVGVVKDVKERLRSQRWTENVYVPYTQVPPQRLGQANFLVRVVGNPQSLIPALRREAQAVEQDLAFEAIKTQAEETNQWITEERSLATLLTFFALLALGLASLGLYGVMSYTVAQGTREIGIRLALGAEPRNILKLVVGHGMLLAGTGVVLGLVGAIALTRVMNSWLFGLSATDPLTFSVMALLLLVVALLACYLPARRATKVDPMVALRYE